MYIVESCLSDLGRLPLQPSQSSLVLDLLDERGDLLTHFPVIVIQPLSLLWAEQIHLDQLRLYRALRSINFPSSMPGALSPLHVGARAVRLTMVTCSSSK
jgi:hypothetical protein